MRLLSQIVLVCFATSTIVAVASDKPSTEKKNPPKETTMSAQREFIIEARVGADLQTARIWDYNMGAAQQQFKRMYPGKPVSFTSGSREVK